MDCDPHRIYVWRETIYLGAFSLIFQTAFLAEDYLETVI